MKPIRAGACGLLLTMLACTASPAKEENSIGVVEGEFQPPPAKEKSVVWLPIKHLKQEPNLCVPTSASMILAYYGKDISPREIKTLSQGFQWDPKREFTDFTITLFPQLVLCLGQKRAFWKTVVYPDTEEGFQEGLAAIKAELDAGQPVIPDTTLYGGHAFVIAGYNQEKGCLYIVDPNLSAPGLRILTFDQLKKIWNSSGVGFQHRAAVFTKK